MPRKPAKPSVADQNAAPGGAAAVDRALSLLGAFQPGGPLLSLSELAQRTRLYPSTVLRLLASLEHGQLIQRRADGRFALGPEVARLHAIYRESFALESIVLPALRRLVEETGESASFHVRQQQHRLCLYRVDSPQPLRDHIRAGDILPLNQGAGGRVLQAFSGTRGALYQDIRRAGVAVSVGDRVPELFGISAPVFEADGALCGAVTLSGPAQRFQRKHTKAVLAVANAITAGLGGNGRASVVSPQ